MSAIEKLASIQAELKVPKSQINEFAHFNYRSLEDITEAVKPICTKYRAIFTISDEILEISTRFYVKATVKLFCLDDKDCIEATGYARECLNKKGMDESQVTGSASSYARKYACNGLFGIDDTKDADTQDNSTSKPSKPSNQPPKSNITPAVIKAVVDGLNAHYGCDDTYDDKLIITYCEQAKKAGAKGTKGVIDYVVKLTE